MMKTVSALLLLAAATAHAEPWDAEASAAAGIVVGPMTWDGPAALGPGDVHLDDVLVAPALTVEGFFGPWVGDRVAAGIAVDATFVPHTEATLGFTTYVFGYELSASAQVVVRGRRTRWRGGIGAAVANFATAGADIGDPRNVARAEMLRGPVARLAAGWAVSEHLGIDVELRAGYLVSDHMTYVPVTLLVGLRFD